MLLSDQLPDLGMQLFDLTVTTRLRALTRAPIKGPRRPLHQLLLPSMNLVGMNLVALRQIGDARIPAPPPRRASP